MGAQEGCYISERLQPRIDSHLWCLVVTLSAGEFIDTIDNQPGDTTKEWEQYSMVSAGWWEKKPKNVHPRLSSSNLCWSRPPQKADLGPALPWNRDVSHAVFTGQHLHETKGLLQPLPSLFGPQAWEKQIPPRRQDSCRQCLVVVAVQFVLEAKGLVMWAVWERQHSTSEWSVETIAALWSLCSEQVLLGWHLFLLHTEHKSNTQTSWCGGARVNPSVVW